MNLIIEKLVNSLFKDNYKTSCKYDTLNNIRNIIYNYYNLNNKLDERWDLIDYDTIMESEDEMGSALDLELNNFDSHIGDLILTNVPIIYCFSTNAMLNSLKVGFTTVGAKRRIEQWRKYFPDAMLIGVWTSVELLKTKDENGEEIQQKVFFQDHPVHRRIESRGYNNVTREEFDTAWDKLAEDDFVFDVSDKVKKSIKDVVKHYSSEFFYKKNVNTEILLELGEEIISLIIDEIKENIRNGNQDNIDIYDIATQSKKYEGTSPLSIQQFELTDIQKEAIESGRNAIVNKSRTHILLAAVMRFGKTIVSYHIAKKINAKYVLITSAKADTRTAWRNDIYHKNLMNNETQFCFLEFDWVKYKNFILYTDKDTYKKPISLYDNNGNLIHNLIENIGKNNNKVVCLYVTALDLSGMLSDNNRFIKDRHSEIFNITWDILIADESHYALRSNVHGAALASVDTSDEEDDNNLNMSFGRDENGNEIIMSETTESELNSVLSSDADQQIIKDNVIRPIKTKVQLHLSGTPYQIMTTDEFKEDDVIGRYSFTDMLEARDNWYTDNVENGDKAEWLSPYYGIPNMIRIGMNLTSECKKILERKSTVETDSFSVLFDYDRTKLKFKYEKAITNFMKAIFGDPRKSDKDPVGFLNRSEIKNGEVMKHIIICMPNDTSCHILAELLNSKIFKGRNEIRDIIVAVSNGTTESNASKFKYTGGRMHNCATPDKINDYLNQLESKGKLSVILTVNRLLTGVSIPLADCIFMMNNTENALNYDLAAFRITTRNVRKLTDKDGNFLGFVNLKENVYLIDFKVERLFKIVLDSIRCLNLIKGEKTLNDVEKRVNETLDKMPIYFDGIGDKLGLMKELKATDFMKWYTRYSSEMNINDDISRNIDNFRNSILNDEDLMSIVNLFDEKKMNKTHSKVGATEEEGTAVMDFHQKEMSNVKKDKGGFISDRGLKEQDNEWKVLKLKASNMLRNILYFCLCNDNIESLNLLIDFVKRDKDNEFALKCFNLNIEILLSLNEKLDPISRNIIDQKIYNIMVLSNDKSKSDLNKLEMNMHKIGLIDKNEVPIPEDLCNKLLGKIPENELKNFNCILLVNSVYGDMLIALYKKYGKDFVELKCKLVPSSKMGYIFCKNTCKKLGLDPEIIVIYKNIEDLNKKILGYDIEDWLMTDKDKIMKTNNGKKFDLIVANPPFNLGDRMLEKYFDIAKNILTVLPSTWLLGKKKKKGICDHFRSGEYIGEIESIDGNKYFDAYIAGVMTINCFYENKNSTLHNGCYIKYNNKIYNDIDEINLISNDPILNKFKKLIAENCKIDNIHNHIYREPDTLAFPGRPVIKDLNENIWCYRLMAFSGHSTLKSKLSGDFYSIVNKTVKYEDICGLYKDLKKKKGTLDKTTGKVKPFLQYYITFETEEELRNFWNYVHTRFIMLCLYCNKIGLNLSSVLLQVPWLDFSKSYTDDDLFKMFNISDKEKEYVYSIIPDYFNNTK